MNNPPGGNGTGLDLSNESNTALFSSFFTTFFSFESHTLTQMLCVQQNLRSQTWDYELLRTKADSIKSPSLK